MVEATLAQSALAVNVDDLLEILDIHTTYAHEKRCTKCGETKSVGEFHNSSKTRDGLSFWCRACAADKYQRQKAADPDKVREQHARSARKFAEKRRGRPVPAKQLAKIAEWQANNRDKVREYKANYRERNREKLRQYAREYNKRPSRRQIHLARKRLHSALRNGWNYHGEGEHISYRDWIGLCAAFDYVCCYCGGEATDIEHLTPLVRGGKNELGNLAPACEACNARKGTKTAEEFAPRLAPFIRFINANWRRIKDL